MLNLLDGILTKAPLNIRGVAVVHLYVLTCTYVYTQYCKADGWIDRQNGSSRQLVSSNGCLCRSLYPMSIAVLRKRCALSSSYKIDVGGLLAKAYAYGSFKMYHDAVSVMCVFASASCF